MIKKTALERRLDKIEELVYQLESDFIDSSSKAVFTNEVVQKLINEVSRLQDDVDTSSLVLREGHLYEDASLNLVYITNIRNNIWFSKYPVIGVKFWKVGNGYTKGLGIKTKYTLSGEWCENPRRISERIVKEFKYGD